VDWLIPGIVALNIMGTSMWGIGFAIVQSRMRKLLKRLVASPMLKREYLLAQVGGRLVLLAPEAGVPLLFGVLVLGLPVVARSRRRRLCVWSVRWRSAASVCCWPAARVPSKPFQA
jgi:ABC-type multidrug transport system permease subunit